MHCNRFKSDGHLPVIWSMARKVFERDVRNTAKFGGFQISHDPFSTSTEQLFRLKYCLESVFCSIGF